MERPNFFNTRKGQRLQLIARRLERRRFLIDVERLRGKGSMKAREQLEFQKEILAELDRRGFSTFRGPVVTELVFFSSQPNPPMLHTLAKNYLDLLEKPVSGLKTDRKRLVYHNDRQIKLLSVLYHLSPDVGTPSIHIEIDRLSRLRADLDLFERINRDQFEKERYPHRSSSSERFIRHEHEDPHEAFNRAYEALSNTIRSKEFWVKKVSEEAYQALLEIDTRMAQKAFLTSTESSVRDAVLHSLRHDKRLRNKNVSELNLGNTRIRIDPVEMHASLRDMMRSLLVFQPSSVDLSHAPEHSGDSDRFEKAIRSAIADFRNRYKWLFPLRIPLSAIIMVVPPPNGIDLDNLARRIIPIVHEIWEPPRSRLHMIDLGRVNDENLRRHFQLELEAEKRFPKISLTKYEAVELPRSKEDPPHGLVRIALGNGLNPESMRARIDDVLRDWEQHRDRY